MTDAVIYVSITRGTETLTLDGNLYLFGQLLATLNDAARQLTQADSNTVNASSIDDPIQEGNHVTD